MLLNRPPNEWMEGFPIGNGRLAAMVWGNSDCDILSLNHEQLWSNNYCDRELSSGFHPSLLESVRFLLEENDFYRATASANAFFGGFGGKSKIPERCDSYQPAGDLYFQIDDVINYENRELNLETGIATIKRKTKKGMINSTFFCHLDEGVVVGRWEGDFSGVLHFERKRSKNKIKFFEINSEGLRYDYCISNGFRYAVTLTLKTDGITNIIGDKIAITDAKYLTIYINIATQCEGIEKELEKYFIANSKSFEELKKSHSENFKHYMNNVCFEIFDNEDCDNLSIDRRLNRIKNGIKDNTLPVLYFNYGRYLLLSSSYKSKLPANLQGKWNNTFNPPWHCDYHLDINLQMNYWISEPLNMPECSDSLFNFIESLVPHGKKMAKELYNCRGIYFPLNTDASGRCTPEACGWSVWIGAAPWLAQHLWWHYIYTQDVDFLENRAYPIFKLIAEFYEDYLVEDKNGVLQIMPSCSPENKFTGAGGKAFPVSIAVSSAMDVQLAYDCLGYAINSANILKIDNLQCRKWRSMREKLPPFAIGIDGRLLEWNEEKEEVEPGHRHLSHLYGLYPSNIFNPIDAPEQYEASRKSLEYRLSHDGGYTGWSCAWVTACYARLGESEKAFDTLMRMFTDFSTDSLLSLHPPKIFQIDGNLGQTAAILEMLVQFWGNKLHLLRALPNEWTNGKIYGVRIPGGHTISIIWTNSKLKEFTVNFLKDDIVTICVPTGEELVIEGKKDSTYKKVF